MSKQGDDLEAVRTVVDAVQSFGAEDQQRIFRWTAEKLGLPQPFATAGPTTGRGPATSSPAIPPSHPSANVPAGSAAQDIKSFVATKNPRTDIQFAATVAYFYRFQAPEGEKKVSITKDDLIDACRKVDRPRPAKPYLTLNNAFQAGLLDRVEKGAFSINSVGENLVAMTLPADSSQRPKSPKKHSTKQARAKKVKKA